MLPVFINENFVPPMTQKPCTVPVVHAKLLNLEDLSLQAMAISTWSRQLSQQISKIIICLLNSVINSWHFKIKLPSVLEGLVFVVMLSGCIFIKSRQQKGKVNHIQNAKTNFHKTLYVGSGRLKCYTCGLLSPKLISIFVLIV